MNYRECISDFKIFLQPARIFRSAVPAGLRIPHLCILAVSGQQLAVSALLHNPSVLHHINAVGIPGGGQTVGNENYRFIRGDFTQRLI